jgi:hypothetical protein
MKAVLAAILVSVAILFVYGLTVGSPATTTYVFITVVLVVVLWLIHRSAAFPLPVLWGLAAVGVGNMLGGVLLIGGAAGAVVEMVEFAGVNVFPETNVGDYGNNMLDLVANFVGAAAAAFLLGRSRVRPDPIHARINRA